MAENTRRNVRATKTNKQNRNQMAPWNEMFTVSNQKQIVTLFQVILQFCELNSSWM